MPSQPTEEDIFAVERHETEGVKHLHLNGVVDEFADLAFLSHLQGKVVVHMGGVRRINSFGVRLWMDVVRTIPESADVVFVEVPAPIMEQMNLVRDFFGRGRLESFVAPMVCQGCQRSVKQVYTVAECRENDPPGLPSPTCSRCGALLELDDIEEQYLAFLKDS